MWRSRRPEKAAAQANYYKQSFWKTAKPPFKKVFTALLRPFLGLVRPRYRKRT